jgi:hypothetical protein
MLQPTSFLHKHVRDVELAAAHEDAGIGLVSFLAALCSATAVFSIQVLMFLLLRKRVKKILYYSLMQVFDSF